MNIEIKGTNDEFFTIQTKPMGEFTVATDGNRSCIAKTEQDAINFFESLEAPVDAEEVVEELPQPPPNTGAPIENFKQTNSFDYFAGTAWAGNKQQF